jgi:alpha-tubulin suppressor-like RCC1 family protein
MSIYIYIYIYRCLCNNGDVFTFGRNNVSQLGHDNANPGVPTKVDDSTFDGKKVMQVAAGRMHSAALLDNGLVYTWGCGTDGALGHGNKTNQLTPKLVEKLKNKKAVDIACGRDYTVVVMDDGSVYSFGRDGNGQLGQGRQSLVVSDPKKVAIPSMEKAMKVAAGDAHVVLATESGKVFSWGDGQQGQLGHGTNTNIYLPREIEYFIEEKEKITDVAAGASHSGCISEDGKLYLFGKGRSGQLGRGDQLESNAAYRVRPVKVEGLTNVLQVALGKEHSLCLVKEH